MNLTASEWVQRYAAGDADVAGFYATRAFEPATARRNTNPLSAEELAEWKGWLGERGMAALGAEAEKLADPEALAVVTGQQAGAALGPLYVLYKAIGAKRHADAVAKATGRPCAAVFWIASDDHDVDEVSEAVWLDAQGAVQSRALARVDAPKNRSVFREEIDHAAAVQLAEELTQLGGGNWDAAEALRAALRPGATFEDQFAALFARWLAPLGIVPVVPRLGFLRRRALPILRRELAACAETNRIVRAAGERIGALGFEPPLHRKGDEVNFFAEVGGVRAKLAVRGEEIAAFDPVSGAELARWTAAEIAALVEAGPGRFSPNAILRPLVQDAAFPTAAYVGGPGEVIYHAQLGGLYAAFDVPRPAVVPRPSVLLVEPRAEKALRKLGIEHPDYAGMTAESLDHAIAAAAPRVAGREAADNAIAGFELALHQLAHEVSAAVQDPAVAKSLEKLHAANETAIGKLRERIAFHFDSRDADRTRHRQRAMDALFPRGAPQERTLGVATLLGTMNGIAAIPQIAAAIDERRAGVQPIILSELA